MLVCPNCKNDIGIDFYCKHCTIAYPLAFGVPVFCSYTADDYFSISEILQSAYCVRKENYDEFDISDFLSDLHKLPFECTRDEAVIKLGWAEEPFWFPSRFQEHQEFIELTRGLDFAGKSLLDVGAGYGSDSLRYSLKGAQVTALEYSPSMFAIGHKLRPEFNWIGGSADHLPFKDNSFDFVVAHHSLHHHLSPKQSLIEMLRVLKVGGTLITSGDPFVSHEIDEIGQCEIFNDHPGVLAGINEQVMPFSIIRNFIASCGTSIKGSILSREPGDSFSKVSNLERFCQSVPPSFSAAIKIVKLNQNQPAMIEKSSTHLNIQVTEIVEAIDKCLELDLILKYLPNEYFNLPILSNYFPKFFLLNGWKQFNTFEKYRTSSSKFKYFVYLEEDSFCSITFKIDSNYQTSEFVLTINGHQVPYEIIKSQNNFICTTQNPLTKNEYGTRICIEFSQVERIEISSLNDAASVKIKVSDISLLSKQNNYILPQNQPNTFLRFFRGLRDNKNRIGRVVLRRLS